MIFGQNIARGGIPLRAAIAKQISHDFDDVLLPLNAFMDTPNSSQQINYHNLDIRLDRVLYVPFNSDIQRSDVFIYDNEKYEFVGDLQDQGGQHIVWNAPVRRV